MSTVEHVSYTPTRTRFTEPSPSAARRSSMAAYATRQHSGWECVARAIDTMRELADDWDGDGAVAPSAAVVSNALRITSSLELRDDFPPPSRVLPSVNGTIVFEWRFGDWYSEIEVENGSCATFRTVAPGSLTASSDYFCVE